MKLFTHEFPIHKIAEQTNLAYNTTLKAILTIRHAILAHADDANTLLGGEIELDKSYFGGKGKRDRNAAEKVPVFGMLERDGRLHVEVVPDIKATTLLDTTIPKARYGGLVYTDKYKYYNTLIFFGYRNREINHQIRSTNNKAYANGRGNFGCLVKRWLIKHHGISPRWFPFYLKELEFRYNHRHEDIFPMIVDFLCDHVPSIQ